MELVLIFPLPLASRYPPLLHCHVCSW